MYWMRSGWTWVVFLSVFALVGCSGDTITSEQREKAREAVTKGLDAWKAGEEAKKWADEKAPLRFIDHNWSEGSKLVNYEIVEIKGNVDGVPMANVKMTITQPKGSGEIEINSLYGVNLEKSEQTIVSRDPMS